MRREVLAGLGAVALSLLLAACGGRQNLSTAPPPDPQRGGGAPVAVTPSDGSNAPAPGQGGNTPGSDLPAPALENAPAPTTATSPGNSPAGGSAAASGAPVQLAYRFEKGATTRYGVEMQLQMQMQTEAPGGANAPAPGMGGMNMSMGQRMKMEYDNKVVSVDSRGNARITLTVRGLEMTMEGGPMGTIRMVLENGKLNMFHNGQPMPAENNPMIQGLNQWLAKGMTISVNRNGKPVQTPQARRGPLDSAMLGAGAGGFAPIVLPARPVRVGDTWRDSTKSALPAGAFGGGGQMQLTWDTRYRLKEIREVNGRRLAVIESRGTARVSGGRPTGGPRISRLRVTADGIADFDIAAGNLARANQNFQLQQSMEMTPPPRPAGSAGAPPPSGPIRMTLRADGKAQLTRR